MFNPTRDQSRDFLFDVWAKHGAGRPLSPLESMALAVVLEHPEYHAVLGDRDRYLDHEWRPEGGETNPFLHLSLHLAVAEQLAIDQPRGIVAHYERLRAARGDPHDALHALLECLGETIWQAQRTGSAPDGDTYLACLERQR